ncbi:hypothetical protein Tco_0210471 [Tanacetum coccineum]
MQIQVKQGRLTATTATENGVALDEEQLLFVAGGQANAVDEDMDEQPVQDLALNVDNVFQADDCDSFDSDVDEAPTAHTMFMANLSFADPVYDEASPSYDSNILSEVHNNDHYQDVVCEYHEVHENKLNYMKDGPSLELTEKRTNDDESDKNSNVQPDSITGHEYQTNHVLAIVNIKGYLKNKLKSWRKMNDKMKTPEVCEKKVKISPHDYLKENYLATFTPQKQLTPKQIFWSKDLNKMKAEALKTQATASRPIKALTVYPPNTPATLVPRVLPTKSQVKINIFALIQLFSDFEKTCNKRITPTGLTEGERGFEQTKACYLTEVIPFFKTLKEHFEGIQKALTKEIKEMKDIFEELEAEVDQNGVDRKHDEIERKNLLIANDNLIADCLSKEVFYVATNSELNVSSFTEMHDAHTSLKARCLELEVELSNLRDKIQKDNHDELIKRFSNLEVNHLNLQLKYQNLKESFGNNTSPPARDVPDFDSVFVIEKMKASIQGKDNAIKKLRIQISQLKETRSEADRTLDFRTLDFQITQLTEKINVLQEQNRLFREENGKIKQHYKELYDSTNITRAKHLEQTTALLTENESLKVQIQNKLSCVNKDHVKPKVLAPGKYAIDVEPIPPHNRNNRKVHLVYLKHLKESVETLREIVEEAKVEIPLDSSLASACLYTKHSQELLEYVIGTCPKDLNT